VYICQKIEEMTIYAVYDQIAELIARLDPITVLGLKANDAMQERLETLIDKSRESELSRQEKDELDHYIVLERLMRLAKIRAQAPVITSSL
jgi:hypothetical protein